MIFELLIPIAQVNARVVQAAIIIPIDEKANQIQSKIKLKCSTGK